MGFFNRMAKAQQSAKDKGTSASKSAQAQKGKGAKAKKKTWTKTKVKDKLNNDVFPDQKRFDKIMVNGSVARAVLRACAATGEIRPVGDVCDSKFDLFTGIKAKSALEKKAEEEAAAAAKKK